MHLRKSTVVWWAGRITPSRLHSNPRNRSPQKQTSIKTDFQTCTMQRSQSPARKANAPRRHDVPGLRGRREAQWCIAGRLPFPENTDGGPGKSKAGLIFIRCTRKSTPGSSLGSSHTPGLLDTTRHECARHYRKSKYLDDFVSNFATGSLNRRFRQLPSLELPAGRLSRRLSYKMSYAIIIISNTLINS